MIKMKHLAGRRCICVSASRTIIKGKVGTILGTDSSDFMNQEVYDHSSVLVEFDQFVDGHTGGYSSLGQPRGKRGHCWWCYINELKINEYTRLE